MHKIANILFDLGTSTYLLPYLRRQFEDLQFTNYDLQSAICEEGGEDGRATADDDAEAGDKRVPVAGVRILTDADEGSAAPDREFDQACAAAALPVLVLHCPAIVCTGMQGLPRRIAEGIYKGRYVQIRGNEARLSVVHAVDVARAACLSAGSQGTFTLTDCIDPTVNALADALAHRLNGKRLFTIAPRWARLWYGKDYYATLTTDHTAPCTYCQAFPDFRPQSVTEYLTTHVYDESSL